MSPKSKLVIVGIVALALIGGGAYAYQNNAGPFTYKCAGEKAEKCNSVTLKTHINKGDSGFGVTIVPTHILEESRCATGVQCIQAGTVRVRALMESGMGEAPQDFRLNTPITTEAHSVELVEVTPYPKEGKQIEEGDYEFTFKVTKRTDLTY